MYKLPVAIYTALISASDYTSQFDALLKVSRSLNFIVSKNNISVARQDLPIVIPHIPNDLPDEELGLKVYRGWLRCAGYHQINLFVFAGSRVEADKLVSLFESEVNKQPNKRKDIFESDTLEYSGQIVYEDLSIEEFQKQKQSAEIQNGPSFTILPYAQIST